MTARYNHRYVHAPGAGFQCVLTVTAPGRLMRCIYSEYWPTADEARQQADDLASRADALFARRAQDERRHYESLAVADFRTRTGAAP